MDFVFNVARGKTGYYASLPGANDALILVPLEADALEDDQTIQDYDTLTAILASNTESSIGRLTLASGVTGTVDDLSDAFNVDIDVDPVWPLAVGDPLGALIVCYDPDTTGGSDADLIPLTKHDFFTEPNGTDLVAAVSATGFYRSH